MGIITLKKVYLRNFISHKETMLTFDKGVTVLVGPNGAGKSSIVEAIYYALTGEVLRGGRRRKDVIINEVSRSPEAYVKLWLDDGGREIIIERRHRRIGKSFTDTVVRVGNNVFMSSEEVRKIITSIFGIPESSLKEVLETLAIIPQGRISEILELKPHERKELMNKLLGLEAYEKAYDNIDKIEVSVNTRKYGLKVYSAKRKFMDMLRSDYLRLISDIKNTEERINSLSKEVEDLRKELSSINAREKEIEVKLNDLRKRREELIRIIGSRGGLENSYNILKGIVNDLRRKIKEVESKLESIKKEGELLRELENKASMLDIVKNAMEISNELKGKEALLQAKLREYEIIKRDAERLRRLKKAYGSIDNLRRLVKEIANVDAELNNIESIIKRNEEILSQVKDEIVRRESKVNEYRYRVDAILNKVSEALHTDIHSLQDAQVALKDSISMLKREYEEVRTTYNEVYGRLEGLRSLINEVRSKLRLLRESRDRARCPLCNQPLDEEHRRSVIGKLESELRSYEAESEKLSKELERLNEAKESLEADIQYLREIEVRVNDALKDYELISRLKSEIHELRLKLNEISKELERLRKRRDELQRLASIKDHVVKDLEEYEDLITRNISDDAVNRVEREVRELDGEVGRLRRELNNTLRRIREVLNTDNLSNALKICEDASRKVIELRERLKERESLEAELKRLRRDYEAKADEMRRIEERLREMEKYIKEYEELESKLKETEEEWRRVRDTKLKIEGKIERLIKERDELVSNLNDLRSDAEKLKRVWIKLSILMWIRNNVYHKDGVPRILRREMISSIESIMKEYLEEFNLSYSDVRIDEDTLDVTLISDRAEINASRLSGGELIATSIALLLALHQVVFKGRVGFLILDEPTVFLDDERRKQMIDIFKNNFRGGRHIPQLIIVTHHDEVKDAADSIYEVTKDIYSRVREVSEEKIVVRGNIKIAT